MEAGSGGGGSSVRPLTLACLALAQTREAEPLCQQRRAGAHQAPAGPAQTPPFPLLPKALAKERSEESYVTCFIIRTWKNSCEASARPGVQSPSGIYLAVRGLCPWGSKPSAPSLERDQTPVLLSVSSLRGAGFCHWAGLV